MALQVTTAKRKFILEKGSKEIVLKDPHSKMELNDVVKHYSNVHPELSTAVIKGPKIENGEAVYRFSTVLGDKG